MIPDFQTIMLPLLKLSTDGKLRKRIDYENALAEHFQVTEEERKQRLNSGAPRFQNRVSWAGLYLRRANLMHAPQRGLSGITEAGRELLKQPLTRIDIDFLSQFSGFEKFRDKRLDSVDGVVQPSSPQMNEETTPDEMIGGSGDGGIDGIVYEDVLGLDVIYLQAKRWKDAKVGRPEIQKFVGALMDKRARKGIFITTSSFSREAIEYAGRSDYRIILIDGPRLANLMIDYDIGVTTTARYSLKKVDQDFYQDA